jgi:hypothetical protein
MEITTLFAMDSCPRCHGQPQVGHRLGQYQARCECGVCGPSVKSAHEAARRWRSVTHYMRQHEAGVGEMLQLAVHEKSPTEPYAVICARRAH